ncbi:MAG: Kelch repeat-containing protein [Flammeovirgaceae bacterium]
MYVVGGFDGEESTDSCERYDTLNDTWEKLPPLPLKAFAINLVVIEKRFIVAFGLTRNRGE